MSKNVQEEVINIEEENKDTDRRKDEDDLLSLAGRTVSISPITNSDINRMFRNKSVNGKMHPFILPPMDTFDTPPGPNPYIYIYIYI